MQLPIDSRAGPAVERNGFRSRRVVDKSQHAIVNLVPSQVPDFYLVTFGQRPQPDYAGLLSAVWAGLWDQNNVQPGDFLARQAT